MKRKLGTLIAAFLLVSAAANSETLEERVSRLEKELAQTKVDMEKKSTANVVTSLADGFEFHGYARAGMLIDQEGDKGSAFQRAPKKYRLGNESDTYAEAELVKNFNVGDAKGSFHYMLAFGTENWNSWSEIDIATRQVYADITPLGGPTYWIGKRFYAREDIHINDYYFKDFSGTGAGVQGIKLGNGSLDLALIGTTPLDFENMSKTDKVSRNEYTLHGKYFTGPWSFEAATHYMSDADKDYYGNKLEESAVWGAQGAVNYNLPGFYGSQQGWSKVVLQLGYGLGAGDGLGGSAAWGGEREDTLSVNLLTFGQSNLTDNLQIMPEFGYRYDNNYSGEDVSRHWITTGVRLVNPITKHFAMQYEAGLDYVMAKEKGEESLDAGLFKFTIAPTIKLDTSNFWGRPELRAFVTYGQGFGDDKYIRTNNDGKAEQSGVNFGFQAEVWF